MNIQYAIADGEVYVLEANPRASRTVPLVSKVCNVQMAKIATRLMNGAKLIELQLEHRPVRHFGVKEAVFPFNMLPEVDPLLGPEMRSTGEVLGLASSPGLAFFKAQEAAGQTLPQDGVVLISIARRDRDGLITVAQQFKELGFSIVATEGTKAYLEENGINAEHIKKLHEGRPNILDMIKNRELHLIINTPAGAESEYDDSYIRKNAIKHRIPYITTLAAASSAAGGIAERRNGPPDAKSLQLYHLDTES
jgi:carbamoyl-phosphate synthase large subunit